ncbi:MAG: response regulator [Bacteroidales bacterium]|jgi:CheY-like chemotaxis protein
MDIKNQSGIKIPDWTGKKILIVEDVETNMLFFKAALSRTGATLLWAMDGFESIEMCQNDPEINIVLMDLRMPNLDGFKATEAIKSFRPNLPVIAQTTYTEDVDTDRLFDAGCDDYLPKPIRFEDLLLSIGKLIDR